MGETLARVVYAEVLEAAGDPEAAASTIRAARASVLARADAIGDPELRRGFLEDVPENARALELAAKYDA